MSSSFVYMLIHLALSALYVIDTIGMDHTQSPQRGIGALWSLGMTDTNRTQTPHTFATSLKGTFFIFFFARLLQYRRQIIVFF